MNIPKNPTGLFINKGIFTVLSWDQVLKDIDNNYTTITAYNIYKGSGNNISKMILSATITDLFEANIVKTVFFDFSNSNSFYAVQAVNSFGTSSIVSVNSIGGMVVQPMTVNNKLIWNTSLWNQQLWN